VRVERLPGFINRRKPFRKMAQKYLLELFGFACLGLSAVLHIL